MSIFPGKLDEIPEISIDRFDGANLASTAFFLTHCHSDHMKGLGSAEFKEALCERDDVFLYTSEISCCILKNHWDYRHLAAKIKPLSSVGCKLLTIPSLAEPNSEIYLQVTLLPAGHCPGSVMFFFELPLGNLLYTGDIRLTLDNVCSIADLHHKDGTPKKIKSLYLDATFFADIYPKFPMREESFREICKLAKEWLELSQDNEILIDIAANYGAEFIYCELKKKLGMRVHVPQKKVETFRSIKEISAAITNDRSQTRIHACAFKRNLPSECSRHGVKFLTLRISCFWYEKDYAERGILSEVTHDYTRVCYACHCSQKELIDFIEYLLPEKVVACAIPNYKTKDLVENEIMGLVRACKKRRGLNSSEDLWGEKISDSLKFQVRKKILTSPRKRRRFICLSPGVSSEESSPQFNTRHVKKFSVSNDQEKIAMDKLQASEPSAEENCVQKKGNHCVVEAVGDMISTPGSQGKSSEIEVMGGSYESEMESSPSLLPQFSSKIVDPTLDNSLSPDCYVMCRSQEEKEIEVITLSSDDSPEIFTMD
ncbi:protein artemis-like isoform X2 [Ischnura elegans]|uniref:protein artemis-like isoform X2 n=1 Tax=Ischnura elegans TaxID=197161 RepID=UPI001ED89174|nr:protein artemis-like isoform X2 [Ischnura elegans]